MAESDVVFRRNFSLSPETNFHWVESLFWVSASVLQVTTNNNNKTLLSNHWGQIALCKNVTTVFSSSLPNKCAQQVIITPIRLTDSQSLTVTVSLLINHIMHFDLPQNAGKPERSWTNNPPVTPCDCVAHHGIYCRLMICYLLLTYDLLLTNEDQLFGRKTNK